MTLKGMKVRAYNAGRADAKAGRVFRHSFEKGSELRLMELGKHYDAGWHSVRDKK